MTLSIQHWFERARTAESAPKPLGSPLRLISSAIEGVVAQYVGLDLGRDASAPLEAPLEAPLDDEPPPPTRRSGVLPAPAANPSAPQGPARAQDLYRSYARPRTSEMLEAIGLDVEYSRARGDYLYYHRDGGPEIAVLDMLGGFGATLFGHNHPELCEVLVEHVRQGGTTHAQASTRGHAARLAQRLSDRVGATTGRSYVTTLSNSGAEAVESALKHAEMELWEKRRAHLARLRNNVARALHEAREGKVAFAPTTDLRIAPPDDVSHATLTAYFAAITTAAEAALARPPIAYGVESAFHGKTLGALQLTYGAHYRAPWVRAGVAAFLPFEDDQALTQALAREALEIDDVEFDELGKVVVSKRRVTRVSACFAEPIQGEGGVRTLSKGFLESMRRAADEHDVPLVFDEVQSGMGRTGTFLASEHHGVRADYYCFSKALGGGLVKIGAMLVDRERYQHEFGYLHTSTFAEDDTSCAVALRALDLLERDSGRLMRDCAAKGRSLVAQLESVQREFPQVIAEVRGRGLLVGFRLASQASSPSPLLRVLSEQKLLGFVLAGHLLKLENIRVAPALSSHETLRVEPSAYVDHGDIDRFVQALRRVCAHVAQADVAALCGFMLGDATPRAPAAVSLQRDEGDRDASPTATPLRKVAFLAHFRDGKDLPLFDAAFTPYDAASCEAFLDKTSPVLDPFVLASRRVTSATGDAVQLNVIIVPFTAAQASAALRSGKTDRLLALISDATALAYAQGASVVGCGAYTSILSDNCRQIAHRGVGVTSGNSLTVAAAVQALEDAAGELNLGRRTLGVVGATGNIGATLAEVAVDKVDEIVLVGRPGAASRLSRLASRFTKPVRVESSLDALRGCNMIVSASNSPVPIIRAEHVGEGPVVLCDVAVPSDVDPSVMAQRPNARVLRGGLLKLPAGQDLRLRALDLPDRRVYACLGEALVLGLSGMESSFSFGPLRAEKVRLVRSLAAHHGFTVDSNALAGR